MFINLTLLKRKVGLYYDFYSFYDTKLISADDWKADQIRWINNGVTSLPKKCPAVKKSYFILDSENGPSEKFKKQVYQMRDNQNYTIVHYIGDHSLIKQFPHRNATTSNKNFVRTCPSTMKKISKDCKLHKANVVYKQEVSQASITGNQVPTVLPRNLKQLQNLRFKHLSESRLSRDDLYNLHEIAYDNDSFVHKIITYPDLTCICGLGTILNEAHKVLQLKDPGQLLSYDTTFQMGNFYVSTLLFRHLIFQESPCIPAIFMIHERKFTETHQELFKQAGNLIPSIKSSKSCIVTDRESAIMKAVELELPTLHHLQCWNHLYRDIRFWLRKHGAPNTDIAVYIDDISHLFQACTAEEYNKHLLEFSKTWDPTFEQYFKKEIHPLVPDHIGRWKLESLQLYNSYSGVTNNQSEGLEYHCSDK